MTGVQTCALPICALVAVAGVAVALRRRNQCSLGGMRRFRMQLLLLAAAALATYGVLYLLTTALGRLAG